MGFDVPRRHSLTATFLMLRLFTFLHPPLLWSLSLRCCELFIGIHLLRLGSTTLWLFFFLNRLWFSRNDFCLFEQSSLDEKQGLHFPLAIRQKYLEVRSCIGSVGSSPRSMTLLALGIWLGFQYWVWFHSCQVALKSN